MQYTLSPPTLLPSCSPTSSSTSSSSRWSLLLLLLLLSLLLLLKGHTSIIALENKLKKTQSSRRATRQTEGDRERRGDRQRVLRLAAGRAARAAKRSSGVSWQGVASYYWPASLPPLRAPPCAAARSPQFALNVKIMQWTKFKRKWFTLPAGERALLKWGSERRTHHHHHHHHQRRHHHRHCREHLQQTEQERPKEIAFSNNCYNNNNENSENHLKQQLPQLNSNWRRGCCLRNGTKLNWTALAHTHRRIDDTYCVPWHNMLHVEQPPRTHVKTYCERCQRKYFTSCLRFAALEYLWLRRHHLTCLLASYALPRLVLRSLPSFFRFRSRSRSQFKGQEFFTFN